MSPDHESPSSVKSTEVHTWEFLKIMISSHLRRCRILLFPTLQVSSATGTNWSIGSSIWTWGRTSSLWGWRSTGPGCPGRLWSLLLWRCSRPAWMQSCAACCRWPCFGMGVGLDDPHRSLPTPTILWFLWTATTSFLNVYTVFVFFDWSVKVQQTVSKHYKLVESDLWVYKY